jgi:hypothetical protein
MSGAITPLPNTPSWRGVQLKHWDNFIFTFYLLRSSYSKRSLPFMLSVELVCICHPHMCASCLDNFAILHSFTLLIFCENTGDTQHSNIRDPTNSFIRPLHIITRPLNSTYRSSVRSNVQKRRLLERTSSPGWTLPRPAI